MRNFHQWNDTNSVVFVVIVGIYNIYSGGGGWWLKPTQRVSFKPCQDLGFVGSYHRGNDVGLLVCRFLTYRVPEARGEVSQPIQAREIDTG